MVGRYNANRDDVVGADDNGFSGHRHHRIEVTSGKRIAEVAKIIGEKSLYQREVGAERRFQQVGLSIDLDALLAVLDRRAEACLRQDTAQSASTRADALD